jgi:predicted nucleic acid-binding Zn ribbon protein
MDDPPPDACEVCGEAPVEKVLYPAAIHFKGSGFYSTDYGRRGRRPAAKEGGDGDGSPDSGGESKKPDKPEPKAAEA